MANRAGEVGGEVVGCMTDGRKWDDHEVHEQKDKFTVDQTAEDRALDKDTKFSAGYVVNRRSTECDGEVAKKANGSGCPSHLT